MVSPKTRGIRGRGTRLKKQAVKKVSGGILALICALFSIGLTLEGISVSTIINSPINLLSLIGLFLGIVAIIVAVGLWKEGHKLQHYWKRKRNIKDRFRIRSKSRKR